MPALTLEGGLPLQPGRGGPAPGIIAQQITEEAAIIPAQGEELRVELIAAEGDIVPQGRPVARLRAAPAIALVAPMAGRLATVQYRPGHRLVQMVFFSEAGGDRHPFATTGAGSDPAATRALMQQAGLWRLIRSRPFGHMPGAAETAAAIFVMAIDSRPGAADPRQAIEGRESDFERGLAALAGLSGDRMFLCAGPGRLPGEDRPDVTRITCGGMHPMGLAGLNIHRRFPASPRRRVWEIHAEDVADLGALIATGLLPPTRLVSLGGNALRQPRLVRCQPGADLRGLSRAWVKPGAHEVLSGSALDGHASHWLAPRHRQASILSRRAPAPRPHWFQAALQSASRPLPIIPTAALAQSLGGVLPAAALARALGAGDTETAVKLGALSLLEDDLALAAYVTGSDPPLSRLLRALLDAVESEEVGQ